MFVPCPHCRGTGKVQHKCTPVDLVPLKVYYDTFGYGWHETLGVYRCRVCGQLWKIRWQWDAGTGSDDIWLRPGEREGGYEFTLKEAEEVQNGGE